MSYYTRPFQLRVMIVSENWSPQRSFHDLYTEIDSLPTLPHPSTIRTLAHLENLIRSGVLERLRIFTEGEVQRREMERVRVMRVLGMSAHMGRGDGRMMRDGEGRWVGVVGTTTLDEGNLRDFLDELYRRRDSRDYVEVRVDPPARPVAGPSRRSPTPTRIPLTSTCGVTREARESQDDARRRRMEREDEEYLAEGRRIREQRERLGRRL